MRNSFYHHISVVFQTYQTGLNGLPGLCVVACIWFFPVRSTASKRHASPISICGWFKTKTHLRTQYQLVKTTHLTKLRTCCDASNIPSEDTARCAEDACTQDRAHYQVVQLVYVHQCQRYLLSQKMSFWDAPALFLYRFVYIALHVGCMYDDR